MIHNQGWHKENPMHVCLFVFEIKIREQCELQTRMKKKKKKNYLFLNEKKNLNPPPQNPILKTNICHKQQQSTREGTINLSTHEILQKKSRQMETLLRSLTIIN